MKDVVIKLSKYPFAFGNCAIGAMAHVFDVPSQLITNVFKLMNIDCRDGCTYNDCRKMIYFMGRSFNKEVKYIKWGNTLRSFIRKHKEGRYLILEDIHLSYYENGVIHDSYRALFSIPTYLVGHNDVDVLKTHVLGAWKITNTPPTPEEVRNDIVLRAWERKIALKV